MVPILREFRRSDLESVECWFADAETRRWLGDEQWPRQLLLLVAASPLRWAYLALVDGEPVGLFDVDCYGDGRAAFAVVVAPEHRSQGIAVEMLRVLLRESALADVTEFFGGVEQGHAASFALMRSAGFVQSSDGLDEEGFTYFTLRRSRKGRCRDRDDALTCAE